MPRKARADSNVQEALQGLVDGLESIVVNVRALLAAPDPNEWISQARSPLGRRRHCRLVRDGKLPGYKHEGQVYVKRADLDAFITKYKVAPKAPKASDEETQAALVEATLRKAQEFKPRRARK